MFIDTSVIVAILANESDAAAFATKLAERGRCLTSGLVILEASMRLSSLLNVDPRAAEIRILQMLEAANILVVPIDADIASKAVAALAAFGKGCGHPAQLDLADCMAYACAQAHRAPLLFKGNDFSHTDIQVA